ncbi:MAG: response regulator [Phycisphaerae bacterium]|nr:response regulator [Phycisphaerae bacterium]
MRSPMELRRKAVLIVDDEPGIGALVRETLTRRGLACWVATGPSGAKALLESQSFDVLITDIRMPGGGGMELLMYARKRIPDCKVILITGNSERDYISQALQLGAYDYIEKPFDAEQLADVVARAINGEPDDSALPGRAAEAMELASQAKDALLNCVRALVLAVEAKDPHTRRHSEQVAHYAVNLAESLSVPRAMVEHIRVAALLHDIGKIAVPDHILAKPGKLTVEEFEYVRRHPAIGAQILGAISFLKNEALLVKHHHERWDGDGYPDCLTGEETPFASRIICVADCIDAMLMARVYKGGYSVDKMLGELNRNAGTQFDPKIALAAVAWCRANSDRLILSSSQPVRDDIARGLFGGKVELAGVVRHPGPGQPSVGLGFREFRDAT